MGPLGPRSRADRQRCVGFTLAETLVVILVIGLAAGLAYVRLDSDPRQTVEREARRLAAALEHAAALAQWRNQTLGVAASGAGYRFWRREAGVDGDRWVPMIDDEVLAPHALPERIAATVRDYAGQSVSADAILPLASSGRNEPYTIEVGSPEWRVLLAADPLNRVALTAASPR
jgi:type II secretion system protein H